MTIRGLPTASALGAVLAMTAGCSDAPATGHADAAVIAARDLKPDAKPDDCLLVVWPEQRDPDAAFDRTHDAADGGAISCATGTTASQFAAAIDTLRAAARKGDRAALLRQVGMPLLFVDARGHRREITDHAEVDHAFDQVFDPQMLDLLKRIDLSQLTVVPDRGAFFELGSLWLVVNRKGGRPRLVTVNRQALGEAAAAARRAADDGAGRAL